MKQYTIEEQDEIGKTLARILQLRRDRDHKDRWQMTWGNKTNVGVFNTILAIARKIENGEEIRG